MITSTQGSISSLLAILGARLSARDFICFEAGFQDPRALVSRDFSARVSQVERLDPDLARAAGATVVGLNCAAVGGWRRWRLWSPEWRVIVLHEGKYDILRFAASEEVPGLTWVGSDRLGEAARIAETWLRSD